MEINNNINTGQGMSTGPTFNNEQSGDGAINKQAMEIVEGDKAETIDKSQTSTTETHVDTGGGEFSGTIKGGDNIQGGTQTIEQAIKEAFDAMTAEADAQGVPKWEPPVEPRVIPSGLDMSTDGEDKPVVFDDFESLDIPPIDDNSDHPQAVAYAMASYADKPVPSVEEQKTFFQRMASTVKKYGQSDVAKGLAGTAAGVIDIISDNAPWQYKVAKYLLGKVAGTT